MAIAEDVKIIRFGLGEVVCNWGTYEGKPAVFIEPVPVAGEVGTSAEKAYQEMGRSREDVASGGVILQFVKPDGAGVLIQNINAALEKFYGKNPIK